VSSKEIVRIEFSGLEWETDHRNGTGSKRKNRVISTSKGNNIGMNIRYLLGI